MGYPVVASRSLRPWDGSALSCRFIFPPPPTLNMSAVPRTARYHLTTACGVNVMQREGRLCAYCMSAHTDDLFHSLSLWGAL